MADCALYLITPPQIELEAFLPQLDAALAAAPGAGVEIACLQLRLKDVPDTEVLAAAKAIKPVLAAHGAALIINDSVDVCAAVGADGVHLGAMDMRVKDARKRLGGGPIIGATAKNSRHVAMEAGEQGADYVAFGAFHPSETKADTVPADTELLTWWQGVMELPCVAIGGITPERAGALSIAGADFLAVSSAVWSHAGGPAAAVAAFNAALDEAEAAF